MENYQSKPSDQAEIIGIKKHPEAGWSKYFSDNTYQPIDQDPEVIVDRLERLGDPVSVKRRSHKLAFVAASLIAAEGIFIGSSIVQNQGDIVGGLDHAANVQISAFFGGIDTLEDLAK